MSSRTGIIVQRQCQKTNQWLCVKTFDTWSEAVAARSALEALLPSHEFRLHEPGAINRCADDARKSLLLVTKMAHARGLNAVADAFDRLATDVEEAIASFDLGLLEEDDCITAEKEDD